MGALDPLARQRDAENEALELEAPAVHATLSPLGRRATFPPDIPAQAAEARGTRFNGTIGQITDGSGRPLALSPMATALGNMEEGDRDRAFLYSPVPGLDELRRVWREWQRQGVERPADTTLPVVTAGLTHGLAIAADLFTRDGQSVVVPSPFWGNYRQVFHLRRGARMVGGPMFDGGRYDPLAVPKLLRQLPPGEPAVVVLNIPSNPTGYAPTVEERAALVAGLCEEAERRQLVVICDDAYVGLVFDESIPVKSIFWDLCDVHPSLVPVKVDGGTKEFVFFGGRVGFITFALPPEGGAARALESKCKCMVRATIGSPVATSQVVLLCGLRSEGIEEQISAVRRRLEQRYRVLKACLAATDRSLIEPLPFNSGCFALVELPSDLDPHEVRRHLIDAEDTGVIASGGRYLRIAFCSVSKDDIPALVERVERGVKHLAGLGTG